MRLKQFFQSKINFIIVLFILIYGAFLLIFKQYSDIWWDGAVYIGIGKYFFSGGQQGFFQAIMYPLFPGILGFFWWLGFEGFSIVYVGKFIIFLLSIVSIYLTYAIGRKLFDKNVGIVAIILLLFNVLFFLFTFRVYTEMISICLLLIIFYIFIIAHERNSRLLLFFSALFCMFIFLNKYTNIFVFIILDIFMLWRSIQNKKFNFFIWFNIFFIISLIPVFLLNYLVSGNPINMITIFNQYIHENLPNVYSLNAYPLPRLIFPSSNLIYFTSLLFLFNVSLPFIFYGFYRSLKDKKDDAFYYRLFLIILAFIFFVMAEVSYLKQERYLLPIFPILCLFGAYGLSKIKARWARLILIMYVVLSLIGSICFFSVHVYSGELDYENFFVKPPVDISCQNVATSDPRSVITYPFIFLYHFDNNWNVSYLHRDNPDCIFYFSCYEKRYEHVKNIIEVSYGQKFYNDNGRCLYSIFKKQ